MELVELSLDILIKSNQFLYCLLETLWETMGFYNAYRYTRIMKYTGLEKMIFIMSFFWFMNWGVRVAQVGINNVLELA